MLRHILLANDLQFGGSAAVSAVDPTVIDPADFRLKVRGQVRQPISLTLHDLLHDFQPFEIRAGYSVRA